jgi:hypothetical protein
MVELDNDAPAEQEQESSSGESGNTVIPSHPGSYRMNPCAILLWWRKESLL